MGLCGGRPLLAGITPGPDDEAPGGGVSKAALDRNRLALEANTHAMTHRRPAITIRNQTGGNAVITAVQVRH